MAKDAKHEGTGEPPPLRGEDARLHDLQQGAVHEDTGEAPPLRGEDARVHDPQQGAVHEGTGEAPPLRGLRASRLRGPSRLRAPDPWLIAAAALALIPILAIARPGIPHTADGYVHILRTLEVSHLLREGVLYPRWAPDFYLGYGYPFFNFYAPGAHLLAALAALTGLGVLGGVVAVQVLALLLYPTGAYLAARSLFAVDATGRWARPAALVSAALYLYAPLRFRELFTQGNLSQLLALALLPWCAWLLLEAVRRVDLRWSAAAGVALAGLVYAHHPSAFLGFPFLAVYAGAVALSAGRAERRASRSTGRRLAVGAAAFLLGILLSAPFWLPSIAELRYVNITAIESGMFNARLNLLPLTELLSPARILDDAALNPPQPNSLGLAQVVMAVAGLAVALKWVIAPKRGGADAGVCARWTQRQAGGTLLVVALMLALALGLMLPLAAPLWERLPLARFIAFPWRLLGPALLWAALLGGAALFAIPARLRTAALLALLVLIPFSVAPYLFPRPFAAVAEPALADIARYELTGGARATASANEYLPVWVADPNPPADLAEMQRAGQPLDPIDRAALPPGSTAVRSDAGPLADAYRLDLPAAAAVRIRRFYFPGWRAAVDGRPAAITPSTPFGFIEVSVPGGVHELRIEFAGTPARTLGGGLALAGVALAIGMLWIGCRSRRGAAPADGGKGEPEDPAWRSALIALATILVSTALVALAIGPHTRWFRQRSPVEAPAAMQHPVHARFANGIELLGYDLESDAPRQGDAVGVRLYWRALAPQNANVRPFLHLDAITGDATWANQTKVHPGDKPSSGWPPGFFVADDYRLLLPLARLHAGLLDERGELVPLAEGGDLAALADLRIRERPPLALASVPGREQSYRLGEAARLVGHSVIVTRTQAAAGGAPALDVALYWQATSKLP
ncbi:MAG: 6-pyruvoyl-tetrahydropterin synthase-related protein, partial [Anaerolineae bacterium]|nr:6-pyruvoyl-tetrahydropterin synthase-related protein [Anaerolineae bacterium]